MKLKDRPLNEVLDERQRKRLYTVIVGGVSWPSKQDGYAILLAMGRETTFSPWCAYAIEEYETSDIYKLIRHCCQLQLKWEPDRWVADIENDAAFEIVARTNMEFERDKGDAWEGFPASPPIILDHKRPYEFISPTIRKNLQEDRKRLYLKNAKAEYMMTLLETREISNYKWGDFPHLEALCFALMDIYTLHEDTFDIQRHKPADRNPMYL